MDQVCKGLFIGDLETAKNKACLLDYNITHIVSCIGTQHFQDITYHTINLDDHPSANIYQYFYDAVEFIDDAISQDKNVYVHCYAGISRSASIVLAYIMAIRKYKLDDALTMLKQSRAICQPNPGFMLQLRCFEWVLDLADEPAIYPKIFTGPVCTGLLDQCKGTGIPLNSKPTLIGWEFNVDGPNIICPLMPAGLGLANYNFDLGLLDVLFDSELDDKYKHIITVSYLTVPAFRPGLINYNISHFTDPANLFNQFDIFKLISSSNPATTPPAAASNPATTPPAAASNPATTPPAAASNPAEQHNKILIVADTFGLLESLYWNLLWRAGFSSTYSAGKYMKTHAPELYNSGSNFYRNAKIEVIFNNRDCLEEVLLDNLDKIDKQYAGYKIMTSIDMVNLKFTNTYFIESVEKKKQELIAKYC